MPEPVGGAHTDPRRAGALLDQVLSRALAEVSALHRPSALERRYEKFRNMGRLGQEFEDRNASA